MLLVIDCVCVYVCTLCAGVNSAVCFSVYRLWLNMYTWTLTRLKETFFWSDFIPDIVFIWVFRWRMKISDPFKLLTSTAVNVDAHIPPLRPIKVSAKCLKCKSITFCCFLRFSSGPISVTEHRDVRPDLIFNIYITNCSVFLSEHFWSNPSH